MKHIFLSLAILVLFSINSIAMAQNENPGQPLTEKRVQNFITALNKIRALDKQSGGRGALSSQKQGSGWSPFSGAAQSIKGHSQANKMRAAIRSAGFTNAADWAQTGGRIYRAFGAIKLGKEQPQMAAKMQKARQQIEKSKMSAEQKKQILKMMEQQMGALAAFQNVPASDKAAVTPHLKTLEAMN